MFNDKQVKTIAKVIAWVLASAMIVTSVSFMSFAQEREGNYDVDTQLSFMKSVMSYVEENYVDDVSMESLMNGAYQGMFESLDPYSVYYPTQEKYKEFVEAVNGEFYGIGVRLENYNKMCRVVTPIKGTPAEAAGILAGDFIVSVNGEDTKNASNAEVSEKIRGPEGTIAEIGIQRGEQLLKIRVERKKVVIASVNSQMKENKVGYIEITNFAENTSKEFERACSALKKQGATSLVIDLRNNPGGLVDAAISIADQLLPKDSILMYYSKQGEIIETYKATKGQTVTLPMVLLVNEGSASASEILAGALKDNNAAILVGTKTFGKGQAQTSLNLKNGGALKLTVLNFLTPNKDVIHHVGITPNVIVGNAVGADYTKAIETISGFAPMSELTKPKKGDMGLNVYGAQQRLQLLGYGDVMISGTMDETTVTALTQFQKSQGLAAYGILDYTTRDCLNQVIADYVNSLKSKGDAQLDKAMEILKVK